MKDFNWKFLLPTAQWIGVEGRVEGAAVTTGKSIKVARAVSEDGLMYYENMTKAILGTDEELMKVITFIKMLLQFSC